MRILISITPRLYREVLALSIRGRRPDFEVLLAPQDSFDWRAERFRPHVLVQDASEAQSPVLSDSVLCRVRMMIADRVDAIVELDGTVSEIHDVRFGDLLGVLERAEMHSEQTLDRRRPASGYRRHR